MDKPTTTEADRDREQRFEVDPPAYEPPRILSREPLESVAAVCTPTPPAKSDLTTCPSGPISS